MLASGHECVTADITAGRCWLRTAVRISGIFGLANASLHERNTPHADVQPITPQQDSNTYAARRHSLSLPVPLFIPYRTQATL